MVQKLNKKGFTVVEIVVVIVLLGIIGLFGTMLLVNIVRSYQMAEDNAHLAQKAQIALTRIAVEMSYADEGSVAIADDAITYDATYPGGMTVSGNEFKRDGSRLVFSKDNQAYTLSDKVAGFVVESIDGYFNVTLTMRGANETLKVFVQSIALP